MSEAHIIVGKHLRATQDGRLELRLSGSGRATVMVRSARPITPRWLGSARPRLVTFGMRRVELRPDVVTTVTLRLHRDQLALLHRMQTIRVAIRLQTPDGLLTRRIDLHSPRYRRGRGRRHSTRASACAAVLRTAGGSRPDGTG